MSMDGNEYDAERRAGTMTLPPLRPAISPSVHLSLTIVYITLYSLLFLIIYAQLWMILVYRHRRFSYQSVFLFLCLVWAGLRTTLFSFYFRNCILANSLGTFAYWLLYCFPVCLQFITLCLLVLFFAQVVFKAKAKYEPNKYKYPLRVSLGLASLVFLIMNLTCAILVKRYEEKADNVPVFISMARVVVNDSLFIICGVALAVFLYKMSKMSSVNVVLEAKGTSKCQALMACVLIVLLYCTRAIYNMIAIARPLNDMLSFGLGWINVSDQADFTDLDEGFAYVSFGIVLFVWEFLPTFIVVLFFRVQRPKNADVQALGAMSSSKYNPRAYFFDNPRRYDSDDDVSLSRSYASRGSVFDGAGTYTINSTASYPNHYGSYSHGLPGTPPAIFTTSGSLPSTAAIHPSQFYDGT